MRVFDYYTEDNQKLAIDKALAPDGKGSDYIDMKNHRFRKNRTSQSIFK
jgi:hypothetical protein